MGFIPLKIAAAYQLQLLGSHAGPLPPSSADSSMKLAAKYSFLKSKSTASFINLVLVFLQNVLTF